MGQIFQRAPQCESGIENPNPLQNFSGDIDENGKIVLSQRDPVSPSQASDYSVTELALMGRSSIAPVRVQTDIVDLPNLLDS